MDRNKFKSFESIMNLKDDNSETIKLVEILK